MRYAMNPEFMKLFEQFTAGDDSIGTNLQRQLGLLHKDEPLLVVTGSEFVLFRGQRLPAVTESFRLNTKGFFEITAISHLGLAIPYLARLREIGFEGWEKAARELVAQCAVVREANTVSYWRDTVAAEAWTGLEEKITDLVDYTCITAEDYIERALADPSLLDFEYMRANLLDGEGPHALPVPFNDMMAATFGLVALDTSYRVIKWLRDQAIDWERVLVIICGRAGRPSAGLTWESNNICHLLYKTSAQKLERQRVLIAPTLPGVELGDFTSDEASAKIEAGYRQMWYGCLSSVEMSRLMFPGYPAFKPSAESSPVVDADTQIITQMPMVRSINDRRAIVSRLRLVMEDPGQQIATAGTQFIVDQLGANGNNPKLVEIPGFTYAEYPAKQ